jgi:hypothetical protein
MTDLADGRMTRSFYREPRRGGSIYRLAITRDAHLGLVPIGGRSTDTAFAVKLLGDSERQDEVVRLLARHSTDYGLAEAACGFIEEVAQVLVAYGEAAYEVIAADAASMTSDAQAETGEERTTRELDLVPPLSLHRVGPLMFQIAPAADGGKLPEILRVSADRIWRVKLPRSLGGARRQRRMLRQLDRLEKRARKFNLNPTELPAGYDFTAAHRAVNAGVIRKTRRWGVIDQPSTQGMTSYYTVAGHIDNRRAQTILRDHIVAHLNELLTKLGLPSIEIEGVPSPSDIVSGLERLRAGEIDLVTANDLTRMP